MLTTSTAPNSFFYIVCPDFISLLSSMLTRLRAYVKTEIISWNDTYVPWLWCCTDVLLPPSFIFPHWPHILTHNRRRAAFIVKERLDSHRAGEHLQSQPFPHEDELSYASRCWTLELNARADWPRTSRLHRFVESPQLHTNPAELGKSALVSRCS